MPRKLSWTPRHYPPGRYCAPACGSGCTRAQYLAAQRAGRALAKRLGNDWKGHVWENMGWHYNARSPCRRLEVSEHKYPRTRTSYTAFLNKAREGGGRWTGDGKIPKAAVARAVKEAKAEYAEIGKIIKGL